MRHTLSLLDAHLQDLCSPSDVEHASYLLCGISRTQQETRLLSRSVIRVLPADIIEASPTGMRIHTRSYLRALQEAARQRAALLFVHTHPSGASRFSPRDDDVDRELQRISDVSGRGNGTGSIVVVGGAIPTVAARLWDNGRRFDAIERIRVIGTRFLLLDKAQGNYQPPAWTDRQVRAFGKETQELLRRLHIGLVGCGGTGSAVFEQLVRLGVGRITVVDDQQFETSNVNRMYGSSVFDGGSRKNNILARLAAVIGTGTDVSVVQGTTADKDVICGLRECDLLFGCTDDHFGRMLLNRLSVRYHIPVIDTAVAIDSQDGVIRDIVGRVTVLRAGSACLRCRERVSTVRMQAELARRRNPEEYAELRRQGYVPELDIPDPSVVMFTSAVAARAVIELIQMLTGFMGGARRTTEVLERFLEGEVRGNSRSGRPACSCCGMSNWGVGDSEPFLGVSW